MRSVPAGSFARLSSPEALWAAWLRVRRGKRRLDGMARFDLTADSSVFALSRALADGRYRPSAYRLSVVHDPKTRLVAAPSIADRVVQTAVLDEIGSAYERGFVDQSYACLTGRGPHRATLAYLRATRRFDYRLCLDIRRYFASVDHAVLLDLFACRLRDERTLGLLAAMIQSGGEVYRTALAVEVLDLAAFPIPLGCGLPLGGYLSHWSGGLYLDGLDHHIKRVLKIPAYLRYMDDMALFSNDRAQLVDARDAICVWLLRERCLNLKDPLAAVYKTSAPSTYLGFRVSRSGLAPGPKAKRRLKQRLRAAAEGASVPLTEGLQAYRGLTLSIG